VFLISFPLYSHDLYVVPDPPILKKPGKISLSMFLQKEQVQWLTSQTVSFRMKGPDGEPDLMDPQKDADNAEAELSKPGTYSIGWEDFPTYIKTDAATFNKYIALDGYTDVIQARKESGQDHAFGYEKYTRFVKTFVQVGPAGTDHFSKPFGYKIEIIPLSNPCMLRIGSELDVKVLFDGAPLAGQKIMATYDSYSDDPNEYAQTGRTNSEGIAVFRMTAAGYWLIRCSHMIPLAGDKYAVWESFWTNITFLVPED